MNNEIELKLGIDKKHASRLGKQAVIIHACTNKPATHKLTNIYFDTPDLKLLEAGVMLRLRHQSKSWIQTIKLAGNVKAGLHERHEWEDLVASNHPDFTKIHDNKIQDKKLIKLFSEQKLRNSIVPIFRTEVQRTEWKLDFSNGDQVELALDLGHLSSNGSQEPISEIELEFKAGKIGRLFDLALELQKAIPLKIENRSKSQRGYSYYLPQPAKVFKANFPILDNKMDANAAFKKIVWECISHLQGNQDVVIEQSDEEGIHQMRVALRRLRSALSLFKKVLGPKSIKPLLTELNWLSGKLGKARDLDVFITQTLPSISGYLEQHQGMLTLERKALDAKAMAYNHVIETLSSQRYHRLLLTLSAWVENERWHKNHKNFKNLQLNELAATTLNKLHSRLLSHSGHFLNMRPEERHTIRIACKKLRYAAEFFASIYASKSSRAYIKLLTQLQDTLGQINDINVTGNLIKTLSGPQPRGSAKEIVDLYEEWNEHSTLQNIVEADKIWKKISTIKPFWI